MDAMHEFTLALKAEAARQGFALSGVTAAATPGRLKEFHEWLDAGFHGSMEYLQSRRDAYNSPMSVLDGCTTILMLAFRYGPDPTPKAKGRKIATDRTYDSTGEKKSLKGSSTSGMVVGKVARYARPQRDYHDVLHERLKLLKNWIVERHPAARVRGVVDTAPLLEREFAEQAGLGWVGKNTLLLNQKIGSYFFLAAILTDLPLTLDPPTEQGHCGTCTRCLTACPTEAFPEPHVLDARRCISYLTIENRDAIDDDVRDKLDGWLFGCDVCQEVCPWNHHATKRQSDALDPEMSHVHRELDVHEILQMTDEGFRERFRKTAFWRPRRRGLLRNAILLAGSQKLHRCIPVLKDLQSDEDPIIRDAARWAADQMA